mgnify:CR=1 FL=1
MKIYTDIEANTSGYKVYGVSFLRPYDVITKEFYDHIHELSPGISRFSNSQNRIAHSGNGNEMFHGKITSDFESMDIHGPVKTYDARSKRCVFVVVIHGQTNVIKYFKKVYDSFEHVTPCDPYSMHSTDSVVSLEQLNINQDTDHTISAWFYATDSNPGPLLTDNMCKPLLMDHRMMLDANDNTLIQPMNVNQSWNDNKWHHYVRVYDHNSKQLIHYMDAKLIKQQIVHKEYNNQPLLLNSSKHPIKEVYTDIFKGYIDELSVFKCKMSIFDVSILYNNYCALDISKHTLWSNNIQCYCSFEQYNPTQHVFTCAPANYTLKCTDFQNAKKSKRCIQAQFTLHNDYPLAEM